jgi:hypothetical protein
MNLHLPVAGQGRLQIVKLTRQHGFHQRGRDRLLARLVARFQCQRQVQLDLQRCAQLGGQDIDGLAAQDRLGIGVRGRAGTEQLQDVFALAAGDAIEREDVGAVADFLHGRATQVVAQFRMKCRFISSDLWFEAGAGRS